MRFFHRSRSKSLCSCGSGRPPVSGRCHNGSFGPGFRPPRCLVLSCAICGVRKEKRFCPAVHGRICPQCCGEQREVTLDCPSDCPYLQQARQHEEPEGSKTCPAEETFPAIEVSEQFLREHEPLMLGVWHTLVQALRSRPQPDGPRGHRRVGEHGKESTNAGEFGSGVSRKRCRAWRSRRSSTRSANFCRSFVSWNRSTSVTRR